MAINLAQYKAAAALIGCEPEVIMSVDQVEAPKGGFDLQGRLRILFEPHVFYNELKHQGINPDKLIATYPKLISSTWNPALYGVFSDQWPKMTQAMSINKIAGQRSASYGRFQILGNNCIPAGYTTADAMIADYMTGEEHQLFSFVHFVKSMGLARALVVKNWAAFAEGYNGAGYKKDLYDTHLLNAYNSLTGKH